MDFFIDAHCKPFLSLHIDREMTLFSFRQKSATHPTFYRFNAFRPQIIQIIIVIALIQTNNTSRVALTHCRSAWVRIISNQDNEATPLDVIIENENGVVIRDIAIDAIYYVYALQFVRPHVEGLF